MIIKPTKGNTYIKSLPFSARHDEKNGTVKFEKGYIFDCYRHESNTEDDFKHGSIYYTPSNINDTFTTESGSKFFVDASRDKDKVIIYKVIKEDEEDEEDGHANRDNPVLIWKDKDGKESIEQCLSENVFLQDYEANRDSAFKIKKIRTEDSTTLFKTNLGYLICPNLSYFELINEIEISQDAEEDRPQSYFEVDVSVTKSEQSSVDYSDYSNIKTVSIDNSSIHFGEMPDDEPIKLHYDAEKEKTTGKYYFNNPEMGNLYFFVNVTAEPEVFIAPFLDTQVRGETFFKNGVSTGRLGFLLEPIPEEDDGYYDTITVTTSYTRYAIVEDVNEDGETYFRVEEDGTHTITITTYVEGGSAISRTTPVVLSTIEETPLSENQFYTDSPDQVEDQTVELGNEVTGAAFSECRGEVAKLEWTNINLWSGDNTVVSLGSGADGYETKTKSSVTYTERRFKKVGQISDDVVSTEYIPDSFYHNCYIVYTDGREESVSADVPYSNNDSLYIDSVWREIEQGGEAVYGKEVISSICSAQSDGSFLQHNITNRFYENGYEKVVINSVSSSIAE